jgi:hypothetical protein
MGRILNPLAGRNQIEAVVMGIGMALLEHTSYDPQQAHRSTVVLPTTLWRLTRCAADRGAFPDFPTRNR